MTRTPHADFPVDQIRAYYADRLHAPQQRFRAAVAETLTDWRLGRASQPANFFGAQEVVRSGIAELLTLRLQAAYTPIFKTLQRIENQLAILASVRDDPYGPPLGDPNSRIQTRAVRTEPMAAIKEPAQ